MIEKAFLNSDMINDNEHIYFACDDNMFEYYKFPIKNNLIDSIEIAVKELKKRGINYNDVYIPFIIYSNTGLAHTKSIDFKMGIVSFIDLLGTKGIKLNYHVMIPDILKDNVK